MLLLPPFHHPYYPNLLLALRAFIYVGGTSPPVVRGHPVPSPKHQRVVEQLETEMLDPLPPPPHLGVEAPLPPQKAWSATPADSGTMRVVTRPQRSR